MAQTNASRLSRSCQNLSLPTEGSLEAYVLQVLNISANSSILHLLKSELTFLQEANHLRGSELIALITVNTTLMIFGAAGALILIAAVARKPRLRTPRTLLTVNLAVSDLTLCLFTQPFNLTRTLHWHYEWQFGEVMCKFTSFAQATNVFVVTMSITVIALERFNVIIHPFRSKRIWNRPLCVLPGLWLLAFLMATPMLAFSTVSTGPIFTETTKPRKVCVEASLRNPQLQRFKYAYGIFTLICQCVVPFAILVAVYIRICTRIRRLSIVRSKNTQQTLPLNNNPPVLITDTPVESATTQSHPPRSCLDVQGLPRQSVGINAVSMLLQKTNEEKRRGKAKKILKTQQLRQDGQGERRQFRLKRKRRANILLTCVSLVFAISWLPLHAVNIFMDYKEHTAASLTASDRSNNEGANEVEKAFMGARQVTLIQSACLLCVLFSCCVNPFLYGYLNENYRKEFAEILTCHCCGCLRPSSRRGSYTRRY
ncbi:g protein coupled receptor [Echinococcus multilocularis]|uniref:G protein coupled receptor n=1 Tax=Echinococcus multilocularis TaxID=6211 RepID=A0A068XZS5_ECHMU|nr:g protein coupled receptor [Echinococcus multilocularis]